jgi:rhamnosyl/mannosyltransferase
VLIAGALTPVKDPVTAMRAFARIPEPSTRLDIVGDGPLRPGLERLADRLGLHDRVAFHGAVQREALPDRYRSASVVLVASRHEAQCMVAVEAAACGTPLVGTAVGVVPELAASGGAIAVPVGDVDALAAALRRLVQDAELRTSMGARAVERARHAWDLRSSVARVEAAWEELVSRSGPARP